MEYYPRLINLAQPRSCSCFFIWNLKFELRSRFRWLIVTNSRDIEWRSYIILRKYMDHLLQMPKSVVVGSTENNKYLKHALCSHATNWSSQDLVSLSSWYKFAAFYIRDTYANDKTHMGNTSNKNVRVNENAWHVLWFVRPQKYWPATTRIECACSSWVGETFWTWKAVLVDVPRVSKFGWATRVRD